MNICLHASDFRYWEKPRSLLVELPIEKTEVFRAGENLTTLLNCGICYPIFIHPRRVFSLVRKPPIHSGPTRRYKLRPQ
jgi:hypothetical protein